MCLELMRKIYQSIFLPKKFRNVNKSINKKGESEVTVILIILTVASLIGWVRWKLSTRAIIYWLLEKRNIEPDVDEIRECTQIVIKKSIDDLLKTKR